MTIVLLRGLTQNQQSVGKSFTMLPFPESLAIDPHFTKPPPHLAVMSRCADPKTQEVESRFHQEPTIRYLRVPLGT